MSEAIPVQVTSEGAHAIARRMAKTVELKNAIANLTTQRDDALAKVVSTEKALEDYRAKAEANPLKKQVDDLRQKIRTFEHRKTFDALATERGVTDPKALDILYEKSGWQADKDEFDPEEMALAIEGQKEALPFLFGKPPEPGSTLKPAPGKGQGNTAKKTSLDPAIIEDDDPRLSDAGWQMKNRDKMVASAKAKIARGDTDPANYRTVIPSVDSITLH